MSPWLYLLLAHLVADFVLQPHELVKLKRQPVGLVIHAGIHTALAAAVAASFLPRWWLIVPLLGLSHYFIDRAKVASSHTQGPRSMAAFLTDQMAHLAALAAAVVAAGLPLRQAVSIGPPAATEVLYFAIPYLTVTFAGAIVLYQLALACGTRPRPEDLLSPRLRAAGYMERGLVLTLLLFFAPAFWAVAAVWYAVRLGMDRGSPGRWAETVGSLALVLVMALIFRQGLS